MLNTVGWSQEAEVEHLRLELAKALREIQRLRAMVPTPKMEAEDHLWLFGYGSLMWNPGTIPWVQRRRCYVRGWKRRLWQRSTDHRGTHDAPGRVATLVETGCDVDAVYGVGYAISKEDAPSVEQYLDYREKDAYLKRYVSLFDSSSGALVTSKCIVYVGMAEAHMDQSENPEHVARIIASRSGPSGTNTEYALMLQNALVREGMHDDHVSAVVHWLYHI